MFAIIYNTTTGEIQSVKAGVESKDELNLSTDQDAILTSNPPQRIGREHKVINGEIVVDDLFILEREKELKKRQVESLYIQATSLPIEFNGHMFQADKASRDALNEVISAAPTDFETDWYDINNEPVRMTLSDLKALAGAILTRNQPIFFSKRQLKDAIEAATTISDLNAIQLQI